MIELSAVIITFNEEANIGRCIDSLQGIVDSIIVVDSFSTDTTEQICNNKGVQFVQHEFEGYIEQKNYALSLTDSPFVLSLDADEALSDKLRDSILKIKDDPQFDGYAMNRLNHYCGKWLRHGGWYPDRKLRLYKNSLGDWKGTNPHDKLILKSGSKVGFLEGDILHYSYYTIKSHIEQANNFSEIAAQTLFKEGKRTSYIKIFLGPIFKLVRDYIFKLGFLDGYYGLVVAIISAQATFLKYAKLRQLGKSQMK